MSTTFFKTGIIYVLALICIAHQSHARTFKDLRVRNCLQAGSLNVCRNALINGDLRVNGTINGPNGPFPAFDVDNGADVIPVNGVVQVSGVSGTGFVPSGIETHNGANNDIFIENRRWETQYVVDPSAQVGQRGTFQTIQAAIDAAVASGQRALVYIRSGLYVENLTLHSNVILAGAGETSTFIFGNHTYNDLGFCEIRFIGFLANGGDIFTVAPTGAGRSDLYLSLCFFRNDGGGVTNCNPGPGVFLTYFELLSQSYAATQNIRASGSRGLIYAAEGVFNNLDLTGAQPMITVDGNARVVTVLQHHFGEGDIYQILSPTARAESYFSESFTGSRTGGANRGYFVNFGTSNGYFIAEHLTINTQSNDGFTVAGLGTYQYGDVLSTISNQIDPVNTTQVVEDWQPYATASIAANAVRGTSAFNNTQFNVTNGFVELFSPFFAYTPVVATGPGPFTYTVLPTDSYIAVDTTAVAATVTLPVSPTIAAGRTFTIKSVAGANNITVDVTGGVFIDGAATQTITAPNGFLQVLYNGSTYEIYGS